ncbi:MAG TPA: class I SAM-dependent methyltransferase [Vicinamibacterales bacterium]|nr:class I SAM-dependent methyltransferase [Vicinamibacterales bacterium]
MRERLEDTLRRLKAERDEADRLYNEALTALDRALPQPPDLPSVTPSYDDHQLASLNGSWKIAPAPPVASGLKGKLVGLIWRVVGPFFERQCAFNSALVDHLNRAHAAQHASYWDVQARVEALRDHVHALFTFHSHLIAYLQRVTPYVDTRERDTRGQTLIVNAAINGVADKVGALEEMRTQASLAHQAAIATRRELERLAAGMPAVASASAAPAPAAVDAPLDAYKYVGFEDRFRGSREQIRERQADYLPMFTGASDVLDVGCGRGEFLDLLSQHGITARGIDLNHEMVEACRSRGLSVDEADAVAYLTGLADGQLGGLFAAQVVEHMPPAYLLRFLELAQQKLRPGAPLVLETLNPACWSAFFDAYIRDITHAWPLHPDTLHYLVLAAGFSDARIDFRGPVPPEERLEPLPESAEAAVRGPFNGNVAKLNERLFSFRDYAIVARR